MVIIMHVVHAEEIDREREREREREGGKYKKISYVFVQQRACLLRPRLGAGRLPPPHPPRPTRLPSHTGRDK